MKTSRIGLSCSPSSLAHHRVLSLTSWTRRGACLAPKIGQKPLNFVKRKRGGGQRSFTFAGESARSAAPQWVSRRGLPAHSRSLPPEDPAEAQYDARRQGGREQLYISPQSTIQTVFTH